MSTIEGYLDPDKEGAREDYEVFHSLFFALEEVVQDLNMEGASIGTPKGFISDWEKPDYATKEQFDKWHDKFDENTTWKDVTQQAKHWEEIAKSIYYGTEEQQQDSFAQKELNRENNDIDGRGR